MLLYIAVCHATNYYATVVSLKLPHILPNIGVTMTDGDSCIVSCGFVLAMLTARQQQTGWYIKSQILSCRDLYAPDFRGSTAVYTFAPYGCRVAYVPLAGVH